MILLKTGKGKSCVRIRWNWLCQHFNW